MLTESEANEMVEYEASEGDVAAVESEPLAPAKSAGDYRIVSVANALDPAYANASTLQLTTEEAAALAADFPDEAFRLGAGGDPDLIYIEHAYLRQRLNQVLGVGASVPIRRNQWTEEFTYWSKTAKKNLVGIRIYVDLVLIVRGCVVGEAIGDSVYYPHNPQTNYSDALESAKSNAFRRCCKEFGIGLQAWMKGWGEGWKQRNSGQQNRNNQPQARPHTKSTNTAKPAEQPEQRRVAPAAVPNFTPPPDLNTSTVDELCAWIDTLGSSAAFHMANTALFGKDSPIISVPERLALCAHLSNTYHAKLDGKSDEVKATVAHITKEIDDMRMKCELDAEAQRF